MKNKAVLMFYIWTSLSPELYTAATTAKFDKDNSHHTERQILDFVKGQIVSKPTHRNVEAVEAMVRTPEFCTTKKPSSEGHLRQRPRPTRLGAASLGEAFNQE